MERKLASIKRITEVRPIEGADTIECAIVDGGWPVVTRKGEFAAGDLALYLEIDSWVPYELAPFLCKGKEPREFNGVKGERLRTIKLRGQISQGLLLPSPEQYTLYDVSEGRDMTELLGIQKWEKPLPAQLTGKARGNFPSWLRKTDQERVQNLAGKIDWDAEYEITTKLDGSSMTLWFKDGDWGVCSRNIDLEKDQEGNAFVDMAQRVVAHFGAFFLESFQGLAFQGELMGPCIQGNREALPRHEFFVFDIWDIEAQEYLNPQDVQHLCSVAGLPHVPTLACCSLRAMGIDSVPSALAYAEGPSLDHPVREGVVFKRADGAFSFKAISNKFLLNEKEGD
jgi:RNA ligase (TIGR02306 family)